MSTVGAHRGAVRANPWRTRWDLKINVVRGNSDSCDGVPSLPDALDGNQAGRSRTAMPKTKPPVDFAFRTLKFKVRSCLSL